ncbi:Putative cell cycle control ATPase [Ignavibacterium album JCM 16511]|uniref:tRNA(Ile)-lysidine synthase n=1 Tax=Ignavibacterium album (strain DSM 19864 / JCM 16511 / NBRC 101810 / Mat9-16) TaxID=945713 RepID=I0AMA0_IGNAJ|nr:tRNA lysidine(34) synthetase TilS [Ignavibacterium album]AFH50107.1 Putative cell cycle control ATPase [Ignavibacterium album JCM 16511]
MNSTEQKVIRFIQTHSLINYGDKILIALSGGPDSVFLLHFLKKFSPKFGIELAAFHLNHSLRKSADKEQKFCKQLCEELSIPFHSSKADVKSYAKKNKISVEEAGRIIRYNLLNDCAEKNYYTKITTAHNADDNAETVLLNISKGTGIKGIAGIPVFRENIIRPILCLSKSEIISYLKEKKIKYVIDESNLSEKYERNFLRLKIIPQLEEKINPAFVNSVLSTSINLQSFINYFEKNLSELKKKYSEEVNGKLKIKISLFKNEEKFFQSGLVINLLSEKFNLKSEQKDVEKIISLIKKKVGTTETLKKKIKAIRERDYIVVFVERSHNEKPIIIRVGESKKVNFHTVSISKVDASDVKLTPDKNIEYVDADLTGDNFLIRKWKPGDKFNPIGMKGTKKISDYLNDIKTEAIEKKNQLVLTSKNKIVWVIGKRLDNRFKITTETKNIYKFELINV